MPAVLVAVSNEYSLVEGLSAGLSEIDAIEAEIDDQLIKVDALRQSILKTAFAGQLVAQDPNDEPASVLLERIRAEKEQFSKGDETIRKTRKRTTV